MPSACQPDTRREGERCVGFVSGETAQRGRRRRRRQTSCPSEGEARSAAPTTAGNLRADAQPKEGRGGEQAEEVGAPQGGKRQSTRASEARAHY